MLLAKQSTARILIVGPILDSAGAEYASAVIGDLSISKNGGTLTALAASATLVYIANGMYTLTLTTGNTDTLGALEISCNKSTYQMRQKELQIVPAMIYDSLVLGTDDLDTNTKKWNDLTAVALPLVPTVAGRTLDVSAGGEAGIDWANIGSPTTAVAFTGSTISASQAVASVTGAVGSVTSGVTVTTNNDKTGYSLASGGLAAVTTWTVGITGNITGNVSGSVGSVTGAVGSVTGNVGGNVTGTVGSVITKTGYSLASTGLDLVTAWTTNITGSLSGSVGSVTGNVGGSVASVTAGVTVTTNNDKTGYSLSQSFPANFASLGINASGHVSRVTLVDTTTTNTDMRGTDNAALAATALSTAVWTTTKAGYLDVAVSSISGGGGLTQADIRTAIGLSSANLDTQLAAIDTDTGNILDGVGWILAANTGAVTNPQSSTASAVITKFGSTYTVAYAGLTSTGVRTAPTLTKA
jgi:hypothetical protein